MAASLIVDSVLIGTLAEIKATTGSFVRQRAFATDYGVGSGGSRRGLELFWNGSAWLFAPYWQPLATLRADWTAPADLNSNAAVSVTLPSLGTADMLRVAHFWTVSNNANSKTVKVVLDGSNGQSIDIASSAVANLITEMRNQASASAQEWFSNNKAVFGATSGSLATTAKDTSVAGKVLTIEALKTTAGDSMVLNYADVWICGGGVA